MNYKLITKNLIESEAEIIFQSCNTKNVFGGGIAKEIKVKIPEAWDADCLAARDKVNILGNISVSDKNDVYNKIVINCYGQPLCSNGKRQTNYEALYNSIEKGKEWIYDNYDQLPIIGFPYLIGCGLGGGRWEIVNQLINVIFEDYKNDILICKLN